MKDGERDSHCVAVLPVESMAGSGLWLQLTHTHTRRKSKETIGSQQQASEWVRSL